MHVIIITDLEGISCVDSIDMIPYDTDGYKKDAIIKKEEACKLLFEQTNLQVWSWAAFLVTVIIHI